MRKFTISFLGLFFSWSMFAQIPAFPGAEGYGSTTPGGRGGEVIKVTNLNAEGPGSLRAALEGNKGPRIVVFETGGEIDLQGDNIIITSPFVTVAGQTAPGDGMPDAWELEYGTDPNVPDDDEDLDADGYTNIEEYINGLICPPA